jgi:hypothetical protein
MDAKMFPSITFNTPQRALSLRRWTRRYRAQCDRIAKMIRTNFTSRWNPQFNHRSFKMQ